MSSPGGCRLGSRKSNPPKKKHQHVLLMSPALIRSGKSQSFTALSNLVFSLLGTIRKTPIILDTILTSNNWCFTLEIECKSTQCYKILLISLAVSIMPLF